MVKIKLKQTHSLSMFGYSLKEPRASIRRAALHDAMKVWGGTYLIKKLNVLYIYRKFHHVTQGKRAHADVKYVQRYIKKHPDSASKRISPNM